MINYYSMLLLAEEAAEGVPAHGVRSVMEDPVQHYLIFLFRCGFTQAEARVCPVAERSSAASGNIPPPEGKPRRTRRKVIFMT